MIEEVHKVPGLEAGIGETSAIADALREGVGRAQTGDCGFLRPPSDRVRRVRKDEEGEGLAMACRIERGE